MGAPMLRSRQHGNPCRVPGHGSRCEVADERRPVTRTQDDRVWRAEAERELSTPQT